MVRSPMIAGGLVPWSLGLGYGAGGVRVGVSSGYEGTTRGGYSSYKGTGWSSLRGGLSETVGRIEAHLPEDRRTMRGARATLRTLTTCVGKEYPGELGLLGVTRVRCWCHGLVLFLWLHHL